MEVNFRIHIGDNIQELSHNNITRYAESCGIDRVAKGRYSSLFVMNLLMLEHYQGIDPCHIIEEIKHLEGMTDFTMTKPATQFRRSPLKGLWHKHFFPPLPSSHAHNIMNHFGKNGMRQLVEEVFNPLKSPVVTQEMITELGERVAHESIEKRHSENKITGEWIVYAKESDKNYYLCVSPHSDDDEIISNNIMITCVSEFDFLSKYGS